MRREPALQPLQCRFDSRSARSKTLLKSANKDQLRWALSPCSLPSRTVCYVFQSVGPSPDALVCLLRRVTPEARRAPARHDEICRPVTDEIRHRLRQIPAEDCRRQSSRAFQNIVFALAGNSEIRWKARPSAQQSFPRHRAKRSIPALSPRAHDIVLRLRRTRVSGRRGCPSKATTNTASNGEPDTYETPNLKRITSPRY